MNGFDRVVVLSGEDSISNSTLDFFGETKACVLDERLPTAFDSKGGGFHVGQGAVCAVFEHEDTLSGAPIAQLVSSFNASEDFDNPIGQRPDGQGFIRAVQGALYSGKIIPERVSVVKTHGTGTQSNDLAERSALSATLPKFIATSYKPSIGHTMGASGLLETVLLLNSLRQGVVPAIANRSEEDSVYLSHDAKTPDGGLLLSLAAGMGNIYSAALFKWSV
jgi:3-oxoacyl-[acyl-carrier-protein] synthase II